MQTNKLVLPLILFMSLSIYSAKPAINKVGAIENVKIISTATITIDEHTVIKEANKYLLGLNHGWNDAPERTSMEDGNVLAVSQDCINVLRASGLRLPLNRMAGSDSQWMKWKEAIGPLENRTLQGKPKKTKRRLGIVEWITLVRSIEPAAEFVLVPNYELETPQDYADLAEFLTGDGSVNINGGENWAKKRIELGIKEPVKVVVWELGNEMDHRIYSKYNKPEPYIAKSIEAIKAIKGVCPDAKFATVGATGPWSGKRDWKGWNKAILQGLGSQIDYLVFHPYYTWLQSSWDAMENYMNEMKKDIQTITGSDRIKFYISEHGIWPSPALVRSTWTRTHDLRGTLATGAFIGRLYKRPDVAFATIHAFSAGPWGVIYLDTIVNKRYMTGIAEMTNAFYNATGEKVVQASLAGKDTVNLETTAMLTDKGMNLVIFNLDPDQKRDVKFKYTSDDAYKLVKEVIITAESLSSYNSFGNKLINTTENIHTDHNAFTKYIVPEKSMVVLYLEKKPAE